MRTWILMAIVRVGAFLATSVSAQDGSLGIVLSLEAPSAHQSESAKTGFVVEFQNKLTEPLRWHPRWLLDVRSFEASARQVFARRCEMTHPVQNVIHHWWALTNGKRTV